MSRSNMNLPPYPVQIGSYKYDSTEKQLHEYVKCGNYVKAKKILKKGIVPDSTNSLGQTPLFMAALLGLRKMADLLLKFGSNPNHRCFDWSTPVHAAAFSCNQWIMSKLIDAGGDLRLHDQECRRPYDWALMAAKDQSAQMLEFIDRCSAHMQALIHCYPLKPMRVDSSQDLISSPSLIDLLSPRNTDKSISKYRKCERISVKKTCNFGYGQLCLQDDRQAGFVLTIPVIDDKSIVQGDSKPTYSFAAGPYMTMTNLLWGCTEVTVKGLSIMAHERCSKERFVDLLVTEQDNMSNLQHPLILQLLALCTSPSLERTRLVFERVTFGSLYNILHERRSEFPILHMETIIHLLLQMIDALIFLHWRGFIHRSFSSHAIQIVSPGKAKISNFEYMVESKDDKKCSDIIHFPIPKRLYCWSPPEIVVGKTVTVKSDLYSLCAVLQESLTDSLPWNGLDGQAIKDAMVSGHYLTVDPRLFKPYDSIISTGIQSRPEERTMNLQDIRYLLKNDFQHIMDTAACTKNASGSVMIEADRDGRMQLAEQAFPVDTFDKVTGRFSYNTTETLYSTESPSDTLCEMTEEANAIDTDIKSLEKKGQGKAEDFDQLDAGSPSVSLSPISASETGTGSNSEEEDTDCESTVPNDNWQAELQTLESRLTSIQIHNRSSLDNLQYIQKFLQEHKIVLDGEEETNQQSESVHVQEASNEGPRRKIADEVDNVVSLFKSKSYAGRSAIGPPLRYMPPDIASCSSNDFIQAHRDVRKTQSERIVDTLRTDFRRDEWCGAHGSFQRRNLDKPSPGQNYNVVTERRSKNSDNCKQDEGIVRNRFYTRANSAQQRPTNIRSGRGLPTNSKSGRQCLRTCGEVCDKEKDEQPQERSHVSSQEDKESKLETLFRQFTVGTRCQYPKDKEPCEIPMGYKPLRDHSKDKDLSVGSSETSYFTPELELSAENSEQEVDETLNVCDESDEIVEGCIPEQGSSMCSGRNKTSGQEKKSFLYWTGDRTLETNMPGVNTLSLSPNTRSIIDVEEISSISYDHKSPARHFTTPESTDASARHSTPVSPEKIKSGVGSKVRSIQENQRKSPDTSCWTSIESLPLNENTSTKTSQPFLSATGDFSDFNALSSLQKKTSTIHGRDASLTPGRNQELGSYEDARLGTCRLLNKTDRECQSMDITSLINETQKNSKCDNSENEMSEEKRTNQKITSLNDPRHNAAEVIDRITVQNENQSPK